MAIKKGLGKGLGALIPINVDEDIKGLHIKEIKLSQIKPNRYQPRRNFDDEKIKELSDSIKEHGVVQPVLLRKKGKDCYELVAGERRWRAAKRAGLTEIPAVLKEYTDLDMAEIALIENIQRENLNPIEEASAYKKLIEDHGLTQEQLSLRVGKSRPFIANTIRLLSLNEAILDYVSRGVMSAGHARTLLSIENKEKQRKFAEEIINNQLSVRQTEELVKNKGNKQKPAKTQKKQPTTIYLQIEEKLRGLLGTQVKVKDAGNKGKIEIDYYSEEDMERIVDVLLGNETF